MDNDNINDNFDDNMKGDDIFFHYFSADDFNSEEEMERARQVFNNLIDNLSLNTEIMQQVSESIKDGNVSFPIMHDSMEEIDEIIKKYNLVISSLEIKKVGENYLVTETWNSEDEGYTMEQKYVLTKETFSDKGDSIQHMIIDRMVELNYEHIDFISELPNEDQVKYYNKLIEEAVDIENYEQAAIYRDLLNSI